MVNNLVRRKVPKITDTGMLQKPQTKNVHSMSSIEVYYTTYVDSDERWESDDDFDIWESDTDLLPNNENVDMFQFNVIAILITVDNRKILLSRFYEPDEFIAHSEGAAIYNFIDSTNKTNVILEPYDSTIERLPLNELIQLVKTQSKYVVKNIYGYDTSESCTDYNVIKEETKVESVSKIISIINELVLSYMY